LKLNKVPLLKNDDCQIKARVICKDSYNQTIDESLEFDLFSANKEKGELRGQYLD
jgi:hypothetical protein